MCLLESHSASLVRDILYATHWQLNGEEIMRFPLIVETSYFETNQKFFQRILKAIWKKAISFGCAVQKTSLINDNIRDPEDTGSTLQGYKSHNIHYFCFTNHCTIGQGVRSKKRKKKSKHWVFILIIKFYAWHLPFQDDGNKSTRPSKRTILHWKAF